MKAALTELWNRADSGQAFAAALAEQGYILARGDRRDFCIVDPAGDEHSLARRLSGVKAADLRARMTDIDRAALPSVAEGRALAHERQDAAGNADAPVMEPPEAARPPALAPSAVEPAPEPTASAFDAILVETVREAARAAMTRDEPDERFARWNGWWETMRQHVAELSRGMQARFGHYLSRGEPEKPEPDHSRGPER